jgi:hypothetical protein
MEKEPFNSIGHEMTAGRFAGEIRKSYDVLIIGDHTPAYAMSRLLMVNDPHAIEIVRAKDLPQTSARPFPIRPVEIPRLISKEPDNRQTRRKKHKQHKGFKRKK